MTLRPDDSAATQPVPRAVRHHRRFALTDVTLDDQPIGGATVDAWQDGRQGACWSVRVMMRSADAAPAGGALAGRMRDGRRVRGQVSLVGVGPTLRPRGPVVVEWGGVGLLEVVGGDAGDGA